MPKETIAISRFKATCLSLLKRVKETGQTIVVTRFGEPIAEVIPPPAPDSEGDWIGSLADTAEIHGDIVSPILSDEDWEATRS